MHGLPIGMQAVGTVTVGASGGNDSVSIAPVRSNTPFRDLGISIIPIESVAPYTVEVYHDGELEEQHTYPDASDRVVCHMAFPNLIFPANIGSDAVPVFYNNNRFSAPGVPIRVVIENRSAAARTFMVYCTYAAYDAPQFLIITQD